MAATAPNLKKDNLIVNSIKYIASKKVFLLNNKIWLNQKDVQIIFSNIGLSTRTSFMKLRGCTLNFYRVEIPDTASKDKPVIIKSEVTDREISFTKPGLKHIDWDLEDLSSSLEMQFAKSNLDFEDWGDQPDLELED